MTNDNPLPTPALTLSDKLMAMNHLTTFVLKKLDVDAMNYSSWVYYFSHLCHGYGILDHLVDPVTSSSNTTPTDPPPKDVEWTKIDFIIRSWIFSTLVPSLRKRLVDLNPTTTKDAWTYIEAIFQDNKRPRALALKAELRNLKLGDLSIDGYFQKIESIVSVLNGLGSPLSNDDVVTFALEGLPSTYETIFAVIVSREPFPDLKTVRSLLTTHEMRLNARRGPSLEKVNNPCWSFAKGSCRFGDACKYLHNGVHGKSTLLPRTSGLASSVPGVTRLDLDMLQYLLAKFGLNAPNISTPSPLVAYMVFVPPGFQSVSAQLSAQPTYGVQTLSGPPHGVHLVPETSQPPVPFMTGVQQQQGGSFSGSVYLGQSPSMLFHPSQLFASGSQGSGQATLLPNAFNTTTLQEPAFGNWNMDTGASCHLNDFVYCLSDILNMCIYPTVAVGDGRFIPVTKSGHSILSTSFRPLCLNNVLITPNIIKNLISVRQFVRDNSCTVEFDPFGFSVKDFITRQVLLRCDSIGSEVLRRLVSSDSISCNKEKLPVLCHACQLGKQVKLPFIIILNTTHKLGPRGHTYPLFLRHVPIIFGYRCLDLNTNKIIISRHVTFDETVFPFPSTKSTTTPYRCVCFWTDSIPFSTIIRTAPITPVPTPVHTPLVDVPTPPTPPTTPTPPPPPTPQFVPQIVPEHAPAPTNDPPTMSIHPMVIRSRVGTTRPNPRYAGHVSTISPLPRVPRPEGANIVRCMWLFRHKFLADGTLSRYKARLVANGSTQVEGVDVDETFSSVVKPGTIRTVLSLAISRHWPVHQLDVKNAFLHGDLAETVYMHQPPGFRDPEHPDYGDDTAFLLLYVDDIVLTASSDRLLQQIIASLHREFSMTDLGALNYFLGISVTRDSSGMFLSQRKYAISSRTPVDTESKLGDGGTPVVDPTLYRSLAGSLQYLTFTRPDITYVVQQVCLYMHDPREPHFSALKRILRYVQGTLDYGLQLFSSTTDSLIAYSDADWAGCPTTRQSTSGYCVFLGNNLLSWSSIRQPTLSRSSAEAEYRGVANAVAETCWIRNLLRELHTPLSSATIVYCDNVSVVYLSSNPVQHQHTKHIEIDIHFVQDLVATGQVRVLHVPSRFQYADIFTKGLPSALFNEFRDSLSVCCTPAPTVGEC
ncbi:ribonuclease H-like domain-containing protein [Tanacetum coccineum]